MYNGLGFAADLLLWPKIAPNRKQSQLALYWGLCYASSPCSLGLKPESQTPGSRIAGSWADNVGSVAMGDLLLLLHRVG